MYLIKSSWRARRPNAAVPAVAFAPWERGGCTETCQTWLFPRPEPVGWEHGLAPPESCCASACLNLLIYRLPTGIVLVQLDGFFSESLERWNGIYEIHEKSWFNLFPVLASFKSTLCVFRVAEPLALQFTSTQSGETNSKELLCVAAFLLFQLYQFV